MKTYTCTHCNNNMLTFSAEAKWDQNKQEFTYKLEDFYFEDSKAFCIICDQWVTFGVVEE